MAGNESSISLSSVITKVLEEHPEIRKALEERTPQGFSIRAIPFSELRKARKISQKELASRIGTTQSQISRLEKRTTLPTMETLHKFAEALDMDLEIIFRPRPSMSDKKEG